TFAERCDQLSAVRVKEAEDGDEVVAGRALIAPGNYHMRLVRAGHGYRGRTDQTAQVNRHRPSVDVLFHSVAEVTRSSAVGALLTGMGADGARGLAALRAARARAVGQGGSPRRGLRWRARE